MRIVINQPWGLGDIIFCMTIARRWKEQGNEIYWPVLPQFVDGCKRAYPDIIFMDWRTMAVDYENRNEHDIVIDGLEYRVVPLRWNVENLNVPYSRCMETKYSWFGWDFKEWKEKAHFKRDAEREQECYSALIGQATQEEYTLVNRYFGSNSQFKAEIPAYGVSMNRANGYSLFDYAKLIENATYIYVANSSILYLLELLDLKAKEIHLYCRKPIEKDFKNTEYLFTKPYILHY